MASALNSDQRRFAKWALLATVAVFAAGWVFEHWFSARWQVAFAPTRSLCLPWRALLADTTVTEPVQRGDLVWFHVDVAAMNRTATGPLPFKPEHKFVKMVAGVPGDVVDISSKGVYVNDAYWGELDLLRKLGRDAAFFYRREVIQPGHYFLLGSAPAAFDSRYWGAVPANRIIGRAKALL